MNDFPFTSSTEDKTITHQNALRGRFGAARHGLISVLMCCAAQVLTGCGADGGSNEQVNDFASAIHSGTPTVDSADGFALSTVSIPGCTGTIIGPRHILTARHCVPKKGSRVNFFKDDTPSGKYATVLTVYHDDFPGPTAGFPVNDGAWDDWAVLFLDSPIPTDRTIARLATTIAPTGTEVWHVGAGGHDNFTLPVGGFMRYRDTSVNSSGNGAIATLTNADPGDSGGPLYSYKPDHSVIVHGDLWGVGKIFETDGTSDVFTSTSSHFYSILRATGLSYDPNLTFDSGVPSRVFSEAGARECAADCRVDASCNAYQYANGSCSFYSAAGPRSGAGNPQIVSGIKKETGDASTPAVAQFPAGAALDYSYCADEGGVCKFGGTKYVAFGVNRKFVYKALTGGTNSPTCDIATFGSDPAPNVQKYCWYANYAFQANEGAVAPTTRSEVAYGANGVFTFKLINGSYTCDSATFGGDPVPNVVKACYRALPDYLQVVTENQTFASYAGFYGAFGANGHFLFQKITSSSSCSAATFGGDPAPGVVKACYFVNSALLAEEGQTKTATTPFKMKYGSGLNGVFLTTTAATSITCSNAFFGSDPDPGVLKHCFAD